MPLITDVLMGLLLAIAISGIAWSRKWLSVNGAIAAASIGTIVWTLGGWKAAVAMLLFFVSSSLLSFLLRPNIVIVDKKDRQPRDSVQVLCNGGIAVVCLVLFFFQKKEFWLGAYWASIAVSTADTWSSSIGNRFAGQVVDIRNGKPLFKGLSGGISLAGSLGGIVGAGLIAITGLLLNNGSFCWIGVLLTGFAGMIIDSLLGSWFQARYRLADGRQVEFASTVDGATLEKGWSWMTNDLVNLLANAIAIGLSVAMLLLCD